jgi:hypothetical protein
MHTTKLFVELFFVAAALPSWAIALPAIDCEGVSVDGSSTTYHFSLSKTGEAELSKTVDGSTTVMAGKFSCVFLPGAGPGPHHPANPKDTLQCSDWNVPPPNQTGNQVVLFTLKGKMNFTHGYANEWSKGSPIWVFTPHGWTAPAQFKCISN